MLTQTIKSTNYAGMRTFEFRKEWEENNYDSSQ